MIQTMELDTYISDLRRHLAPISISETMAAAIGSALPYPKG